ncbi:MAG: hypothetical protein K6A44_03885 [bacterium]|nr:hypothetical protein [bacterium]
MKKAFSLIEIMQTIILLGIIAGLSISFFKKMNTNDKLWTSTTEKLRVTIEEANRQMCNDNTPTCVFSDGMVNRNMPFSLLPQADIDALCSDGYADSHYDPETKNCVYDSGADPCPALSSLYAAVANNDRDLQMTKNSAGICTAPPPCRNAAALETGEYKTDVVPHRYAFANTTYKAFPLSAVTCVNNVPSYQNTVVNMPVLCYYLHSILMHKPQGVDNDADLLRTCTGTVPFYNNAQTVTPAIINAQVAAREAHGTDNYSMLLPNGVYLYNLGSTTYPMNIYIKYDRVQSSKSAKLVEGDTSKSTIGVMRIENPTEPTPAAP